MKNPIRKLIGTIGILLFLILYCLLVAVFAPPILVNAGKITEFFFYLIAGLAWIVPAGLIIQWMQKP